MMSLTPAQVKAMLAAIKAMGANLDAAVEEIRAHLEDIT